MLTISNSGPLPPVRIHQDEHATAVFSSEGMLRVWVSLFGCPISSLLCKASEVSSYGLKDSEGELVVCNAGSGKLKRLPFQKAICDGFRAESASRQSQWPRPTDRPWMDEADRSHKTLPVGEHLDECIYFSVRRIVEEHGAVTFKAEVEPVAVMPYAYFVFEFSREHDSLEQAKALYDRLEKRVFA